MKKCRNVSLNDELLDRALKRAAKRGFDFSNYLAYLINRDLDGSIPNDDYTPINTIEKTHEDTKDEKIETKESNNEETTKAEPNSEEVKIQENPQITNAIDEILGENNF